MPAQDLKLEQFKDYPPEARKLAANYLATLQRLPLAFLPSLLRELIEYDFKFPAERRALEKELANLSALSPAETETWLHGFAQIRLSAALGQMDWINAPAQFVEQLSAHLWSTHQLDAFRAAALDYAARLRLAVPPEAPPMPRLGITIVGQGAGQDTAAAPSHLFRKLRPHGVYFSNVKPDNGAKLLLASVSARATAQPAAFAHWYVDGGQAIEHDPAITSVSYHALEPARAALSSKMRAEIERPGMGPEALRTLLARLRPADLGLNSADDTVLSHFQVKLLTEGSGTQVFSTTFAQWTAREVLRRAQPLTLLVRFAPRQRQRPMNELLYGNRERADLDAEGSLVDADFGAYYNWINQQRLPGDEKSSFVVWFEDHREAVAIGPALPRGTQSSDAVDLSQLLSWTS
ncbi:MAG: hypothetical protein ABSG16_02540 [Candidatus Acidiferrum sp.]|jgi:hypothetical protein